MQPPAWIGVWNNCYSEAAVSVIKVIYFSWIDFFGKSPKKEGNYFFIPEIFFRFFYTFFDCLGPSPKKEGNYPIFPKIFNFFIFILGKNRKNGVKSCRFSLPPVFSENEIKYFGFFGLLIFFVGFYLVFPNFSDFKNMTKNASKWHF